MTGERGEPRGERCGERGPPSSRAALAIAGLLLAAQLVACAPIPLPTPSAPPPNVGPSPTDVAEAQAAAGRFLVNWRIDRYTRMVELLAPGDVARVGAEQIVAQLSDYVRLARVTSLVAEPGGAVRSSLPAGPPEGRAGDTVPGPRPALALTIAFAVESELFGSLEYRRTLRLSRGPDGWLVHWDPSLVLPGLRIGDVLALQRTDAPRGRIVALDGTVFAETHADGVRVYPQEWLAGQTIGWVGRIGSEEAVTLAPLGYREGDLIGRGGLEAGAEQLLRGQPGFALLASGPSGVDRSLLARPMQPGADLQITLRHDLQATADAAIAGYAEAGTAVLDPQSGDVWALASAPRFNPNAMTLGTTLAGQPLPAPSVAARTNHAVQGLYPAGSSFKPFTLAAALRTGVAGPATLMPCRGTWVYHGFTFHNYADHMLPGLVNLLQAMAFSCNTTYMPLSILVYEADPVALTDLVAEFGFGQRTGIGYLEDAAGVLPDAAYFRTHKRWDGRYVAYNGFDQIQLAIGQGSYLGTPLQLAVAYAAFGNGGHVWVPRLVAGANRPDGAPVARAVNREVRRVSLTAEQLAYVVDSMQAVVTYSYGTAYRAFAGFGIPVAGKSGTAETGTPTPDAWFPAIAPADDPQIAVATVLVHVPLATGGSDAAPLVRRVMGTYFAGL